MLQEVRRVLKPGGLFHMLDFDGAHAHGHGSWQRRMHVTLHLEENSVDQVLERMRVAGFANARVVGRQSSLLRRLALYRASAPDAHAGGRA
jgi:hypothetical protein